MLIKEYRIPLPLTVEEYRIAQLYMIAKKSREESKGAGSGVEIIINEPYTNGPGGDGQYTHKIYHVGSHLPGWFKSLLPKSALMVKEEAWNAYPYTKTRYTCPFVEKFSVEIETYYYPDNGYQENVFKLTGSDLRNRITDVIDIVKDQLSGADYVKEEDPVLYISEKTGRGPLSETWLEDYWNDVKEKSQPTPSGKSLMCAYKLCRVEFRYWGMQTKLEKFIQDIDNKIEDDNYQDVMPEDYSSSTSNDDVVLQRSWRRLILLSNSKKSSSCILSDVITASSLRQLPIELDSETEAEKGDNYQDDMPEEFDLNWNIPLALRKTMVRAHRQAWAWQDEWNGLTMEDIREIERETQVALQAKMGLAESNENLQDDEIQDVEKVNETITSQDSKQVAKTLAATLSSIEKNEDLPTPTSLRKSLDTPTNTAVCFNSEISPEDSPTKVNPRNTEKDKTWKSNLSSHLIDSTKNFNAQIENWRMESLVRESESGSDDEFFDCQDDIVFSHSYLQRVASDCTGRRLQIRASASIDISYPASPHHSPTHQSCNITILLIIMHAGSVLDANVDITAKKSDVTTFKGAFESVIRQHYPTLIGHVAIKFVSCPSICTEGLEILSSLSPYSFDVSPSCMDTPQITHDTVPIGAIPLLATSTPDYQNAVTRVINGANQVHQEFTKSEEGLGFNGQVCFVGDSVGSILAYDALCRSTYCQSRHDSKNSILDNYNHENNEGYEDGKHLLAPVLRRKSSSTSDNSQQGKLDFDVSEFFMFGSPLSLVLAYRKISSMKEKISVINRPYVNQVYNLFHPSDPVAARLEPLISTRFSTVPPVNVARYQKYPLGNGHPYHLLETLQTNPQVFADGLNVSNVTMSHLRRLSDISIHSTISGFDTVPLQAVSSLTQKWWGTKRIDYALYCPEGLANFPTNALPHLFHASYWESSDVIAFIVRQLSRFDLQLLGNEGKDLVGFRPSQPREKWNKKRTSVKLKNVAANHRANDVIVRDGAPQILTARFMYGPIGVIALTGEKIDIHIMKDVKTGEWILYSTELTDKSGRIIYQIPDNKTLGYGLYPIKMIVRGDHTSVDFFMAVVPPKTECVVFSIDGSFTASVSVTGRDPKVRAGAVDIVRHWQELGYLIIYITGRPDMQQHKVVSWLSQHNFPHGLISFADGLSTDPLAHKALYLKNLVQDHGVIIHHAYGSNKDISVYTSINLQSHQIFVVGKVPRKNYALATVLHEGYAAHLNILQAHGGSRPAQGNARMVLPRGQFGLPGQNTSLRRRRYQL